jgi:hypothetical protein
MLAVNAYFPGSSFTRNAVVGGSASTWPADNYYPSSLSAVGFVDLNGKNYALASGTPYVRAGTDGKDVGVDFTAMASAMAAGSSPAPAPAPAPAPTPAPISSPTPAPSTSSGSGSSGTAQSATWINVVNATASGNSVTKTSGCDGCNDAGAITQQRITAGDGFAQFTAGANGPLRTAGLSQSFSVSSPGTIAFGIRLQGNYAEVREGGAYRADISFAPGDVFRIAVQSGVVRYSKNGTVFYTSGVAPAYPLVLAAALANKSATVGGAMITSSTSSTSTSSSTPTTPSAPSAPSTSSGSGSVAPSAIVWVNPVNVTASGGSVSKTSGCDGCYDAGAISKQSISGGNGYVQFTAGATGSLRVAGLTASFGVNNPSSIAFGLRLQGGIAEVREAGVYRADVAFAAGDVFRISVQGGAVSYARNGTVFYKSSSTSSSTLALAVSIANMSGGIGNALLSSGN